MKELSDWFVTQIAARFAALAEPQRIRILARLRESPCSVGELAAHLGLAQPSVSKHLAVLKQVGLIHTERQGTVVRCSVADPAVYELCELVCDGVERHLRTQAGHLDAAGRSGGATKRKSGN